MLHPILKLGHPVRIVMLQITALPPYQSKSAPLASGQNCSASSMQTGGGRCPSHPPPPAFTTHPRGSRRNRPRVGPGGPAGSPRERRGAPSRDRRWGWPLPRSPAAERQGPRPALRADPGWTRIRAGTLPASRARSAAAASGGGGGGGGPPADRVIRHEGVRLSHDAKQVYKISNKFIFRKTKAGLWQKKLIFMKELKKLLRN